MLAKKGDYVVLSHNSIPESLKLPILENTQHNCSLLIHILEFLYVDIKVPQEERPGVDRQLTPK